MLSTILPGGKPPTIKLNLTAPPVALPKLRVNISKPSLPATLKLNLTMPDVALLRSTLETYTDAATAQLGPGANLSTTALLANLQTLLTKLPVGAATAATSALASAGNNIAPGFGSDMQAVTGQFGAMLAQAANTMGVPLPDALAAELAGGGVAQPVPASQLPNSGRSLLEVEPISAEAFNARKITAFVNLGLADFWAIMYTTFKTIKAAVTLLNAAMKASVGGVITIDNASLMDFGGNVASLNAEMSDLLSRIFKTTADVTAPLGLRVSP